MAELVVLLASNVAGVRSGQTIVVKGGLRSGSCY